MLERAPAGPPADDGPPTSFAIPSAALRARSRERRLQRYDALLERGGDTADLLRALEQDRAVSLREAILAEPAETVQQRTSQLARLQCVRDEARQWVADKIAEAERHR